MASNQEGTVSLKIFVDKKSHRVILAESDKHFVDILLSFLTLPMGTIVRILGEESADPAQIGSLNNLYESIEKLDADGVLNEGCNNVLLRPHNMWQSLLKKLKVNVDNSEIVRCYTCPKGIHDEDFFWENFIYPDLLSYYANTRCGCGRLMTKEVEFEGPKQCKEGNGEVFITGAHKFLITDDLQIMHSAPTTSLEVLSSTGIKDVNQLFELNLTVGLKEIRSLLKQSLISNSPLTDVFLPNHTSNSGSVSHDLYNNLLLQEWMKAGKVSENISLKLLKRKSDNKVLYAESDADFVDFLFSILLIPLGTVLSLLGATSELECLANLYKSVSAIKSEWFVNSKPNLCASLEFSTSNRCYFFYPCNKSMLRSFIEFSKRSCSNQLLNYHIDPHISYYYDPVNHSYTFRFDRVNSTSEEFRLTDPKDGGYVQRRAMYLISDDLKVTAMSSYSLSSLNKLEFSTDEFEECSVNFSVVEAVHLLKASITSTSSLTDAFFRPALLPTKSKLEQDI